MSARLHVRVGPIGFSGPIGKQPEAPSYGWCGHDTEIAAMFCKRCPELEAEAARERALAEARADVRAAATAAHLSTEELRRYDNSGIWGAAGFVGAFVLTALWIYTWIAAPNVSGVHWFFGLSIPVVLAVGVVKALHAQRLSPEQTKAIQEYYDRECLRIGLEPKG